MTNDRTLVEAVRAVERPLRLASGTDGPTLLPSDAAHFSAYVPPCRLEDLGDGSFHADHKLRYAPCNGIGGAMANGIGSCDIVEAMSNAGMLGFFGAAGLALNVVETAVERLSRSLGDRPWGANLIHSPNEPDLEEAVVDLYLRRGVHLVEASAYLDLTLARSFVIVLHGIHEDATGRIVTPNRVIAKVSRVRFQVASKFSRRRRSGSCKNCFGAGNQITPDTARNWRRGPGGEDLTAEADSGGHTDNRPGYHAHTNTARSTRPDAGAGTAILNHATCRRARQHCDIRHPRRRRSRWERPTC